VKRAALGVLCLVIGCSWSNSLYQARLISGKALQAERQNRPGEARSDWGQVADKADSALARLHSGNGPIEARWLRGRALARMKDCRDATPDLETALAAKPTAKWRDPLLLELARCKEQLHDVTAVAVYHELLHSRDPTIRAEAQERSARVMLDAGRWADALNALQGVTGNAARLDAVRALLGLGRDDSALALVQPLADPPDSSIDWPPIVTGFASHDGPRADTLLGWLLGQGGGTVLHRDSLTLAALRGAIAGDTARVVARYRAATAGNRRGATMAAQAVYAAWMFAGARDVADLRRAIDSTTALAGNEFGGSPAVYRVALERRTALFLVGLDSTTADGAPRGDLTLFAAASFARDSLHADRLAAWFLQRLERGWPRSPYRAKAMLLRSRLEPDSAADVLARLAGDSANPYVELARGEHSDAIRDLEDSLDAFVRAMGRARKSVADEPPADLRFR
jgi:hypothetical protein